ncbi:M23 family metallopeptidase [Homoserinibacter sp. YIM 151385]|uniref:M23 family metallopeptidase n=1 Tax=Homoserinibacter sp. YIM 151385 TaxID=2985506 RepID=UPI0022F12C6C|nr:M23 family metallopeptidase [Homoserinibacter sp. YIM 151385]WBU39165.1 M23 family metallopeptidase [Homoserinibacter sp. YIM 151385]
MTSIACRPSAPRRSRRVREPARGARATWRAWVTRVAALATVLAIAAGGPADGSAAATAATGPRGAVRLESAPRWAWPVPSPHPVVRPFEAPASAYSAGHRGLDVAAREGTVITAPADGVVHFAGVVVDRPLLSLDHGGGLLSSFEPVEPLVERGERVARGQPIGELQLGHCAGACLHLGARLEGRYVSPLRYLDGLRPAVLLPVRR